MGDMYTVDAGPGQWGMETAVQEFAEDLARALPVTVASVALWDHPSFGLTVKAVGMPRPLPQSPRIGTKIWLARSPWHRAVLERQEPVFLDGQGRPAVSLEGNGGHELSLQSVYLVPIRLGEEAIGVLGLGEMRSSARAAFTEQKRSRCRAILDEFVTGSAHAWEAGRVRRQTRAMSSLLRLAQDVMEARSPAEVLAACSAEMSDWVGAPVSGILFRARPDGAMEPIAQHGLPGPFNSHDAAQLILALVRTGADGRWPVSVVSVADDPLDPLNPAMRSGEVWSRVGLPLMRADRLQGIACLYVADDLRPSNWELEAFRRRGELVSLALGVVGALEDHRSEQRRLGGAAYQLLTEHQRTALSETVARILDLVSTQLPPRLARLVPQSGKALEGGTSAPSLAERVADEVLAVLGPVRERMGSPGPIRVEPIDVNGMVQHAVEIARWRWDQHQDGLAPAVEYHMETPSEPLLAQASASLIGAIVHAIENAVEAMPDGGRVRLRTARVNGHVLIAVEDSGSGVPADVQQDAFAPLVSTKERPHLGLGLSVIRSLVNRHGGSVSLSSAGGSTVLEIRLPAVEKSAS